MAMNSNKSVDKFISACDELITCKFLVAEAKIQRILGLLAETPQVYELVSECMEQFNRDREMSKAFVQEAKGGFVCNMPTEEFKVIAVVFCTLADVNAGRINFMDFVKTFFNDEEGVTCFKRFIGVMIIPFRNLIAEAFGYPTIELDKPNFNSGEVKQSEQQETVQPQKEQLFINNEIADKIVDFPVVRNMDSSRYGTELDKVCETTQRITNQILDELEICNKRDYYINELKSICYALIMASSDKDFDMIHGLAIGLKYAGKGVKAIKFLVRELDECVDDFFTAISDLKN